MVKMKIHDVVLIALLSATLTAGKLALSFLPNVHIVALLLMIYTVSLGLRRSLFVAFIFATTEVFIYGFSTWVLAYYIVWPMLVLITAAFKDRPTNEYGYAAIAGLFGLTFGFYFAVIESLFYGYAYGLLYWLRGIPFDVVHGASNYIIVLILFKPLSTLLQQQVEYFETEP